MSDRILEPLGPCVCPTRMTAPGRYEPHDGPCERTGWRVREDGTPVAFTEVCGGSDRLDSNSGQVDESHPVVATRMQRDGRPKVLEEAALFEPHVHEAIAERDRPRMSVMRNDLMQLAESLKSGDGLVPHLIGFVSRLDSALDGSEEVHTDFLMAPTDDDLALAVGDIIEQETDPNALRALADKLRALHAKAERTEEGEERSEAKERLRAALKRQPSAADIELAVAALDKHLGQTATVGVPRTDSNQSSDDASIDAMVAARIARDEAARDAWKGGRR